MCGGLLCWKNTAFTREHFNNSNYSDVLEVFSYVFLVWWSNEIVNFNDDTYSFCILLRLVVLFPIERSKTFV